MKKVYCRTYLNEDKDSLLVASAEIESDHSLPSGFPGVAHQLKRFIKASKP